MEIPREFVEAGQGDERVVVLEEDSTTLPPDEAKLYPRDRKTDVRSVRYYIDDQNFDSIGPDTPIVRLSVWSENAPSWIQEIPLSKLNNF